MAAFPQIPFAVTTVVTSGTDAGVDYYAASGTAFPWAFGDRFCDERGRIFIFLKIDPALTNNATAIGESGSLKAAHTWTNDVSDASNSTYPTFAGVALGAHAESTSTTTVRAALFLVKGRTTVITDGNIVLASAQMCQLNTSSDGAVVLVDETATNLAAGSENMYVGHALADDSGTSLDIFVASKIFG
jgi:hypothetical protein